MMRKNSFFVCLHASSVLGSNFFWKQKRLRQLQLRGPFHNKVPFWSWLQRAPWRREPQIWGYFSEHDNRLSCFMDVAVGSSLRNLFSNFLVLNALMSIILFASKRRQTNVKEGLKAMRSKYIHPLEMQPGHTFDKIDARWQPYHWCGYSDKDLRHGCFLRWSCGYMFAVFLSGQHVTIVKNCWLVNEARKIIKILFHVFPQFL